METALLRLLVPILLLLGLTATSCQRPPQQTEEGGAAQMAAEAKEALEDVLVELGLLEADPAIFPACNMASATAVRRQPPRGTSCEDFSIELRVVATACVAETGVVNLVNAAQAEMQAACSQFCITERNCNFSFINVGDTCAMSSAVGGFGRCPQADCPTLEICTLVGSLNGSNCFCREPV